LAIWEPHLFEGVWMNWEAIGAIGEVAGAVGVIVTLAYLAVQIRQNTRAVRSSTYQALTDSSMSFTALVAGDPALAGIWDNGMTDYSSLDRESQIRFGFLMQNYVRMLENAFHQHEDGMLPGERWLRMAHAIEGVAQRHGFGEWWRAEQRARFSESFEKYVASHLPD
jgi:hypothetical protein